MREQVATYLPNELVERFRHEASRQGISLSAYVTPQLVTVPLQGEEMQLWVPKRLDRLDAAIARVIGLQRRIIKRRARNRRNHL
jgi:hypothetical protein